MFRPCPRRSAPTGCRHIRAGCVWEKRLPLVVGTFDEPEDPSIPRGSRRGWREGPPFVRPRFVRPRQRAVPPHIRASLAAGHDPGVGRHHVLSLSRHPKIMPGPSWLQAFRSSASGTSRTMRSRHQWLSIRLAAASPSRIAIGLLSSLRGRPAARSAKPDSDEHDRHRNCQLVRVTLACSSSGANGRT